MGSGFRVSEAGEVVGCPGCYAAFSPAPVPPKLTYDPELLLALSRGDAAFGKLSHVGGEMPTRSCSTPRASGRRLCARRASRARR